MTSLYTSFVQFYTLSTPLDAISHTLTVMKASGRIFHRETLPQAFKRFLLVGRIAIPRQNQSQTKRKEA